MHKKAVIYGEGDSIGAAVDNIEAALLPFRSELDRAKAVQILQHFEKTYPNSFKNLKINWNGSNTVDDLLYKKDDTHKLPWYKRVGGRALQDTKMGVIRRGVHLGLLPFHVVLNPFVTANTLSNSLAIGKKTGLKDFANTLAELSLFEPFKNPASNKFIQTNLEDLAFLGYNTVNRIPVLPGLIKPQLLNRRLRRTLPKELYSELKPENDTATISNLVTTAVSPLTEPYFNHIPFADVAFDKATEKLVGATMNKSNLYAKTASDDSQKRKAKRSSRYAQILGAGGLGALALGRGVGKADDIAGAEQALANFDPKILELNARGDDRLLNPARTGLTEYISTMAPIANLKPWGIPPSIPMAKLRQQENILSALNIPKDYALKDPAEIAQGKMHYESFGAGPIPAFYHMFRKNFRNTPLADAETKQLKIPSGTNYGDWLERKFENFVQQEYNNKPVLPFEVNRNQLAIPKQQEMLDKFMLSLPPEEQDLRRKYERTLLMNAGTPQEFANFPKQVKSYSIPAKVVLGLRKGLYTAGGAGLGGYAGNRLYNLAGGENPYLQALATTAGTGVGGVGGHYLAKPEVQQQIRDRLTGLGTKALGALDSKLGLRQNLNAGLDTLLKNTISKKAIDINYTPYQTTQPKPSIIERLVTGQQQFNRPTEQNIQNWQTIADYMHAAHPEELNQASVFAGRIDPKVVSSRVQQFKEKDPDLRKLRTAMGKNYKDVTPEEYENYEASYHYHPHAVILQKNSPGALIHELGHAIDLGPLPNTASREDQVNRFANLYDGSTLAQESKAWKKGLKAYQTGYVASPEFGQDNHDAYKEVMKQYYKSKYPAFGTYVGGAAGGLLGAAGGFLGGLYGAHANTDSRAIKVLAATLGKRLGGVLGGAAGVYGGAATGNLLGKMIASYKATRTLKDLDKLKSQITQDPQQLARVSQKLEELRNARKPKSEIENLAKAAALNSLQIQGY